ncbi:MAG: PadR family transcriptional regulator [bacterium]|nr:PadR family transcriptional regulator [bacterium]
MYYLSRIEEIILLAIWKLQDEAYGMSIREQVAVDTGKKWRSGAVYAPLGRLLQNGYVNQVKGEPTPERGGRHKIYYQLTDEGKKALIEIRKVSASIWLGAPKLELD